MNNMTLINCTIVNHDKIEKNKDIVIKDGMIDSIKNPGSLDNFMGKDLAFRNGTR